ncbi:14878_t:CDS:2, partial [Dentiscutata heterogama]
TTTNPLEFYHSELKRIISKQYDLINACNKIVELEDKKKLVQTLEEKETKAHRLHIDNIIEKIYDRYQTAEKKDNENIINEFIRCLNISLSQILDTQTSNMQN